MPRRLMLLQSQLRQLPPLEVPALKQALVLAVAKHEAPSVS